MYRKQVFFIDVYCNVVADSKRNVAVVLLCIILCSGCGAVRPYSGNDRRSVAEAVDFDGVYDNVRNGDNVRDYQSLYRLINWKGDNRRDTARFSSVRIQTSEKRRVRFTFSSITNEKIIETRYRTLTNGFILIKHKNLKVNGIPFILGRYKLNRVELGLLIDNRLIVNGIHKEEGALFFIFPLTVPQSHFTYKFRRME